MREFLSYSFVMPPTIFIVVCVVGALIAYARPRLGTMITLASSGLLYLFATPAVSMFLAGQLSSRVPRNVDFSSAQAIVVPGVDVNWGNGSDIPDTVGIRTLERLAGAAQLYRRLHRPIAVSGGSALDHPSVSVASLMGKELEQDFATPVEFYEDRSHNTFENALFTAQILSKNNIGKVVIVAQASDMLRLLWSFRRVGLYPMPFVTNNKSHHALIYQDFLPSTSALNQSYVALHEIIGLAFYTIFY